MRERLLRGQEVARRLDISLATAYRWMKSGILPVVRVSGARSIRVPEGALERWIKGNTIIDTGASTK
jgi:excisionase family DNA binding protein